MVRTKYRTKESKIARDYDQMSTRLQLPKVLREQVELDRGI
jgi:hypothetical protein